MLSSAHPSTCAWPIPAAPALPCMQTKTLIVVLCLSSLWSHQSHSLCYPKELHPSLSCLLQDACVPWEDMLTNSLSSLTHAPSMVHSILSCNRETTPTWSIVGPLFHSSLSRSLVKSSVCCFFFYFSVWVPKLLFSIGTQFGKTRLANNISRTEIRKLLSAECLAPKQRDWAGTLQREKYQKFLCFLAQG